MSRIKIFGAFKTGKFYTNGHSRFQLRNLKEPQSKNLKFKESSLRKNGLQNSLKVFQQTI